MILRRTAFFGLAALATALLLALPAGAETPISGLDPTQGARIESAPAVEPRMLATISGPVDPATYIVGPGDVLDLHYSGAFSQSVTLTISPEGGAFVRGFGTVKLGGLTLDQARRELRRAVSGDLSHGTQIEVELVRARLMHVFLAGEAATHGPLEIPATARVCEALGADSLMTPSGSRRNIELRHRDGTRDYADLERYLRLGDLGANPMLRDDDILFIPPARAWVEILGAAVHQERLELGTRDSLRNLIELAGGLQPSARTDHALFMRFNSPSARESLWISLEDVIAGRFNPPLRDGDRLFVYYLPEFHRLETAAIYGEVAIPGTYPLQVGVTRLSDLVRVAGGFQPRADLNAIRVYRPRATSSEPDMELERLSRLSRNDMTGSEYEVMRTRMAQRRVDFRVDWNRLTRSPQEDVVLEPGDVVRVEPITLAVRVDGQVRRPGLVRYEPGTSLDRYVKSAGGFSQRAATGRVLVTRSVTGQTLRAREVTQVEPGDMIWVPERSERTIWQNFGTLIAVSAQVATLIIAVRR